MEIRPVRCRADKLHEGKTAHKVRPAGRQMERQRGAPILPDQIGRGNFQLVDQGIEIADMVKKPVSDVGLARPPEADQVGGDAMRHGCNERQDVAPDVRRGGIAVQEQRNRRARFSHFAIGHRRSQQGMMANGNLRMLAHDNSLNTV